MGALHISSIFVFVDSNKHFAFIDSNKCQSGIPAMLSAVLVTDEHLECAYMNATLIYVDVVITVKDP